LRKRVPAFGIMENPIDSLVERYLYNFPCPYIKDLPNRLDRMLKIARNYRVHGLIYYNSKLCDTWRADFKNIENTFYQELLIPTLFIETDYSLSDVETLKRRVEDFIDIIGGRL